jgi:dolichyl-phosphate beta-glucosyltransferase
MVEHNLTGEILVVDDGSLDTTAISAKGFACDDRTILRVISYKPHKGKGFAVKKGMLEAVSDYIVFIDSGSCVPYDNILRGIALIREGICDISHGSRYLADSRIIRPKKWYREISSFLFRKFIDVIINIPFHLTDTQCGLKIYRKEVAHQLYFECITEGFLFDIEIILRANKKGYRIKEFPIEWSSDPDSRLSPLKTMFTLLQEIHRIKKTCRS